MVTTTKGFIIISVHVVVTTAIVAMMTTIRSSVVVRVDDPRIDDGGEGWHRSSCFMCPSILMTMILLRGRLSSLVLE